MTVITIPPDATTEVLRECPWCEEWIPGRLLTAPDATCPECDELLDCDGDGEIAREVSLRVRIEWEWIEETRQGADRPWRKRVKSIEFEPRDALTDPYRQLPTSWVDCLEPVVGSSWVRAVSADTHRVYAVVESEQGQIAVRAWDPGLLDILGWSVGALRVRHRQGRELSPYLRDAEPVPLVEEEN